MWADLFGLSRADPRYLDATDAEIIADLVTTMWRNAAKRRLDPKVAANEEAAAYPEAVAAVDDALRASLSGGRLAEEIERVFGRRQQPEPPPKVKRVRTARVKRE